MSSQPSPANSSATAFAPATVANVAAGFDILGFAIEGVGDEVTVTRTSSPGQVTIEAIDGVTSIPLDARLNTAGLPLIRMLEELDPGFGFSVRIKKGIPLGSGMGGSAASAVGAVVAASALLAQPLSREKLIQYALEGEALASGARHADNLAPCLYGGLTFSEPGDAPAVVSLAYPADLVCVLVHPEMRLDTKDARAALAATLPLKTHIRQSAHLAALLTGCFQGDFELIRRGLKDVAVEPQRARLIPGFAAVQAAALAAGALGCSISGAGPSVFALTAGLKSAESIRSAMIAAFTDAGGLKARGWVSRIAAQGARVV